MEPRTIRKSKVCVTGGAGFLGSHLVEHLLRDRDCYVLVLDNLCAGRREFVPTGAEFVHCDITQSEEFLRQIFVSRQIEYVMSYAAWPYIVDSFSRPKHVFAVNAIGAINVINAAQEAGCKGILQVSSAELYGNYGGPPKNPHEPYNNGITEEDTVSPHSTYGAAKAAVDFYCQCAWKERQTPVIALRQFNALGERDVLHPYVVTTIIEQLMKYKGQEIGIVNLGTNTARDFMYAGDAVKIAVLLLERGEWGNVYNSGSEEAIRVYDLAYMVGWVMGFKEVKVEFDKSRVRPWDIYHLLSDNSKINAVIGAFQRMKLEEALRRTIRWFEENGRRWPWEK